MRKRGLLGFFLMVFLLTGCASSTTHVTVTSTPPGADVVLEDLGLKAKTDGIVEIPKELFEQGVPKRESRRETFVFSMKGHRSVETRQTITKKQPKTIHAKLSPIDTKLIIKSNPPGAMITLGSKTRQGLTKVEWQELLPDGWAEEFTTPKTFICTQKEAKELREAGLYIENVVLEGYFKRSFENSNNPKSNIIDLAPGQDTTILIPMKPVITRLQVISDPPGVIVEDINDGGFGYLGETPLIRNFNWEDVKHWRAKQTVRRGSFEKNNKEFETKISFAAINLKLRMSKSGYEDVYLKNLRIPLGQERAFRKDMKRIVSQINFASDPQGVHVYVEREIEKDVYNEETNQVNVTAVKFKKHLGTTPFTLNIDPNDPIRHGEKLIFEKSGYLNSTMRFALGNDSYHQVMKPEKVLER